MSRKFTNLHLEDGDLRPAECWETDVPGLIVTEGVTSHRSLGLYSVTHEPSGCRISDLLWSSVESARLFCQRISEVADWSGSFDEVKDSLPEGTSDRINEIGQKLQEELDNNPAILLGKAADGTGHATE